MKALAIVAVVILLVLCVVGMGVILSKLLED